MPILSGVEVKTNGSQVAVKGPLGTLTREFPPTITVSVANSQVDVTRQSDERQEIGRASCRERVFGYV